MVQSRTGLSARSVRKMPSKVAGSVPGATCGTKNCGTAGGRPAIGKLQVRPSQQAPPPSKKTMVLRERPSRTQNAKRASVPG